MKKKHERSLANILAGASDSFWKANPDIASAIANPVAKQQVQPLGLSKEAPLAMAKALGFITVRITRQGKRLLDSHDNLRTGCKRLSDAIAQDVFGLKGDTKEDGIDFIFDQRQSTTETDTIVEFWIDNNQGR